MKFLGGDFRNVMSVRRFKKNVVEKEIKKLPEGLDTIYIYSKSEKFSYINPFKYKEEKRVGFWRHMGDSSGQGTPKIFFNRELAPPTGKHWKYSQEKIDTMIDEEKLILECRNCGYKHDKTKGIWKGCPVCGMDNPQPKYWVEEKEEEVLDSNWSDIYGYSTAWDFPTENSEILLKRVIESTSNTPSLRDTPLIEGNYPIDTKYFSEEFKERLLEKLTENANLDDLLDGVLIKSENWQALNLLLGKYKEKVQTIYIDPPYNTGSDEFIYKDKFQHSSWLTMMENRLSLARNLMKDDGVIFVNIDDNELERLKILESYIFGEDKFLETFIWNNTSTPPSLSDISRKNVEYILTFVKSKIKEKFKGRQAEGNDAPLINRGNPIRTLKFPKGSVSFKLPDGIHKKGKKGNVNLLDDVEIKNCINVRDFRLEFESKWSQETLDEEIKKGTTFIIKSENFAIRYLRKEVSKKWITPDKYIDVIFLDKKAGIGTNEDATKEIKNLNLSFSSYPKPSSLLHYLVRMVSAKNDLILDFFAGSGTTAHAVMKLNKEDGGKRKYILV